MLRLRGTAAPLLLPLFFAFAANGQPASNGPEFLQTVTAKFAAWDRDGNGELSKDDIDAAVADPKNTGKDAAAAAALKRAVRNTKTKLPTLTKENLAKILTAPASADRPDLAVIYAAGLVRLEKFGSRELFPAGPPRLQGIHQGKLGNCFCLAPLGAMLDRDPKQVADLFKLQKDGRYVVTLGKHVVEVALPTDAELILTSSNETGGLWLNLYEKAVGEALNRDRPEDKRANSPIDVLGKGGSAGTMLAFITGHEMKRFSCKFAKDKETTREEREAKLQELRGELESAVKEKRLMTCGTLKTTTPGITPNHAYAVLDYDVKEDKIRLWNPHGGAFTPKGPAGPANGYERKNGIFAVPLTEFVDQFSGLAFEVEPATK